MRGPDDAFFTPGYRSVITNEEFNDTLTELALRTRRPIWRYGHAGIAGSSPGYLNTIPGKIVIVDHSGRVDWAFGAQSGPNRLAKPSLAVR